MKSRASCQSYRAYTRSDVPTRISRVKQGWRKSSLATEIISQSVLLRCKHNPRKRHDTKRFSVLLRLISTEE